MIQQQDMFWKLIHPAVFAQRAAVCRIERKFGNRSNLGSELEIARRAAAELVADEIVDEGMVANSEMPAGGNQYDEAIGCG